MLIVSAANEVWSNLCSTRQTPCQFLNDYCGCSRTQRFDRSRVTIPLPPCPMLPTFIPKVSIPWQDSHSTGLSVDRMLCALWRSRLNWILFLANLSPQLILALIKMSSWDSTIFSMWQVVVSDYLWQSQLWCLRRLSTEGIRRLPTSCWCGLCMVWRARSCKFDRTFLCGRSTYDFIPLDSLQVKRKPVHRSFDFVWHKRL